VLTFSSDACLGLTFCIVIKHPDADGLYVEQIDVGEETPRTVVSGLVNYIPIEDMRDKMLITVVRLSLHILPVPRSRVLLVQSEACKHAWSEELCDGSLRASSLIFRLANTDTIF
jgi:hypothetical protein